MDIKTICTSIFGITILGMYLCLRMGSYKIIEESQDRFICKLRPTISWAIATFCAGIIAILLTVFTFAPHITTLECDRFASNSNPQSQNIEPNCKLTEISWRGQELSTILIQRVKEAILETEVSNSSKNGLLDRYGVTLINDDGSFPLTKVLDYKSVSDRPKFFKSIEEIKSFVRDPLAEHLSLQQDDGDFATITIAVIVIIASVAALSLFLAPYITFSCDRQSNLATLERRNLFRQKVSTYQMSDIASVEVQETSDSDSTQYRIRMVLQSGEKVPFTYCFTSGWHGKYWLSRRIQKFLQLKPQVDKL